MKMRSMSEDAVETPVLSVDLAKVYLLCGEQELAIQQFESLEQIPQALTFGELAKLSDWDPLRSEPRFQNLLSQLKPIPIFNRPASAQN